MKVDYFKDYSLHLDRQMEFKVYGHWGRTVLVFPSQNGRFFDFENFGMIDVLAPRIEAGLIKVVCADGIDEETWSDTYGNPRRRIELHERWYHYITQELVDRIRQLNGNSDSMMVAGCSMGGFHAANFFFRRPDLFDTVLALSGIYSADYFFNGYADDLTYANSPLAFLPNMPEGHPHLALYRNRRLFFCVGQGAWEEDLLKSTRELDALLRQRAVPAWFDYWGFDVNHDWPWWKKQLDYFMGRILS